MCFSTGWGSGKRTSPGTSDIGTVTIVVVVVLKSSSMVIQSLGDSWQTGLFYNKPVTNGFFCALILYSMGVHTKEPHGCHWHHCHTDTWTAWTHPRHVFHNCWPRFVRWPCGKRAGLMPWSIRQNMGCRHRCQMTNRPLNPFDGVFLCL